MRVWSRLLVAAPIVGLVVLTPSAPPAAMPVVQTGGAVASGRGDLDNPVWSPDGTRLAFSRFGRLHTATRDGHVSGPLTRWEGPVSLVVEREPSWSPDGRRVVFAADLGSGYALYVVDASGGVPERLTFLPGEARWPAWAPDGRIVFAARDRGQWDLHVLDASPSVAGVPPRPVALTATLEDEMHPAISPDGERVAFVSTRDNDTGDLDLWVMELPRPGEPVEADQHRAVRVVRSRGPEVHPAWSPDGRRLAFAAVRDGVGTVWVVEAGALPWHDQPRLRPASPPVLVARVFGTVAWSPDGQSLLVAEAPEPDLIFRGSPPPDRGDGPPSFPEGTAPALRVIPAPRPADPPASLMEFIDQPWRPDRWAVLFDRTWARLRDLYFSAGRAADEWRRLGERFRPRALAARNLAGFEREVDAMIAAQPVIGPVVRSRGAVIVSAHRLASEIGARALAAGGNVVDAAVATAFAVGVAEPEGSGIGGDGMALVWLTSMPEPVAVDFKDQTPAAATLDNPRIQRDGRLVADGPAAANVPGLVAGLQLLHARYGSGRVSWRDVVEPAASLAAEGITLDGRLPAALAAGRMQLLQHPSTRRLLLPGGRLPRPGDRFINTDLAATLRTIALEGAEAFYRGRIAQRIAADMAAQGGLISLEDLAEYRALERRPVSGVFRGRRVYSAPPPVATGTGLVAALQVLDHYRSAAGAWYLDDADYWHHMIEAWKLREPVTQVADPALWPVDVSRHLSVEEAAAVFRRIDPRRAGEFPAGGPDLEPSGDPEGGAGQGTTAIVVADATGNVVTITQTLSRWGGALYVSEGLGFLYNNHLRSHRPERGTYGHLLPRMRSTSAAAPTIVCDAPDPPCRPTLALAAAGDAWIAASAYGLVSALVDGRLPAQRAVEAPRFLVTRDPADGTGRRARVEVEDRFPRSLLEALSGRGHTFRRIGGKGELKYGFAALARLDVSAGLVEAGADPRRSYVAVDVAPRR